jgi:N-sulfoglucosamine sulfohydrolase
MKSLSRRALMGAAPALLGAAKQRPNILWIIAEDLSPDLSCYANGALYARHVSTPNIDALAAESVRFDAAYSTAPVCSPTRSAFQTGMYQTSIGAQDHRSHREDAYQLPAPAKLVSHRLEEAGYFTCNVREVCEGVKGSGKTDFNFQTAKPAFQGRHWKERATGQPFFAQLCLQATHKGPAFAEAKRYAQHVDREKLELPPYYADHPVVREESGQYLDTVHLLDRQIGAIMKTLREEALFDNTMVFFFGDHGRCLVRSKQWLYEGGVRVPLMVRFPAAAAGKGALRRDLVSLLDVTATTIFEAGLRQPAELEGRPLFGPQAREREYVVAARDRCDETVDKVRMVREARFKLIRNDMPERPWTQPNAYINREYPTQAAMRELFDAGKLNAPQRAWFAATKPPLELYDVQNDPHELRNLAELNEYQATIRRLSRRMLA